MGMRYGLAPFKKSLSHRDIHVSDRMSVPEPMQVPVLPRMRAVTSHSPHSTTALPFIVFMTFSLPKLGFSEYFFFCLEEKAPNRYPQSSDWFRVPLQQAKALSTRDAGDLEHGGEVTLSPAVEPATVTSLALVLFVAKGEGAAFGDLKPDAVLTPAVTFSAVKEGSHIAQETWSMEETCPCHML